MKNYNISLYKVYCLLKRKDILKTKQLRWKREIPQRTSRRPKRRQSEGGRPEEVGDIDQNRRI